jgi:anti-anti-sigma regulatory factor
VIPPLNRTYRRLLKDRARGVINAGIEATRPSVAISRIDDPGGGVRLIAVRGLVAVTTIDALLEVLDGNHDGDAIHLDLTNAILADSESLQLLGAMIDELERRRVGVRIVGIDPLHPALGLTPTDQSLGIFTRRPESPKNPEWRRTGSADNSATPPCA